MLPLIAFGNGLDNMSWGSSWEFSRVATNANQKDWVLCGLNSMDNGWLNRKMSTAEGSIILKDTLNKLGMSLEEASRYSTHSLKATCLSWAAKGGTMDYQERLILGQTPEGRMALTYSRDSLATVLLKLKRLIWAIRAGEFDPDLPRVARLAKTTGLAQKSNFGAKPSEAEQETEQLMHREIERSQQHPDDSDVEESVPVHIDPIPLDGENTIYTDFGPECFLRHQISGILHFGFTTLENWHNQMFQATMREPPLGHRFVTIAQVLSADRELWSHLSQSTRGAMTVVVGKPPPLDAEIKRLTTSPQVLCFMTPLPSSSSSSGPPSKSTSRPTTTSSTPKGSRPNTPRAGDKAKQRKSNTFSIKDLLAALPQGCVSKTEGGKFICLHFNQGTCRFQKQSSCKLGLHICYYKGCGAKRPYTECSH